MPGLEWYRSSFSVEIEIAQKRRTSSPFFGAFGQVEKFHDVFAQL
jgi:hypothetical protein